MSGDRSIYLTDANGTVYLAEPVDVFADDDGAELYRLTEQEADEDTLPLTMQEPAS